MRRSPESGDAGGDGRSGREAVHGAPRNTADGGEVLRNETRFGVVFLQRHGWRLLLLFAGLLLPLWGFTALADEVQEAESFPFDRPLLLAAQTLSGNGYDTVFVFVSAIGYAWGVVPVDMALVLVLAWKRRLHEGLFAGIALGGSALLNLTAKQLFARNRPTLWESIAPETTYSFPSGHAMGSMTLAAVLVLLAWPTRWRWPVAIAMVLFVPMVGLSRISLGVHYPSDILAGWAAALAWTVGIYVLVFRWRTRPWSAAIVR